MEIEWESDGSNSAEHLCVLLKPRLTFKFLPNQAGRMPVPLGTASRAAYNTARTTGPYAQPEAEDEDTERVDVCGADSSLLAVCCLPSVTHIHIYTAHVGARRLQGLGH